MFGPHSASSASATMCGVARRRARSAEMVPRRPGRCARRPACQVATDMHKFFAAGGFEPDFELGELVVSDRGFRADAEPVDCPCRQPAVAPRPPAPNLYAPTRAWRPAPDGSSGACLGCRHAVQGVGDAELVRRPAPIRGPLSSVSRLPKPETITGSPATSASRISSNTASTKRADLSRNWSTSRRTASVRSTRFSTFIATFQISSQPGPAGTPPQPPAL